SQSVSQEGIAVVGVDAGGPAGNYGYMDRAHPAMEAFDNSNLSDFIGHSIVYNIQASKQDEFGEGFFRTVVITPDNGGVDLSIRNLLVFNHFIHGTDGTPVDAGKRRLLEARSEEHTSELQSRENLVCRLLLVKRNLRKVQ